MKANWTECGHQLLLWQFSLRENLFLIDQGYWQTIFSYFFNPFLFPLFRSDFSWINSTSVFLISLKKHLFHPFLCTCRSSFFSMPLDIFIPEEIPQMVPSSLFCTARFPVRYYCFWLYLLNTNFLYWRHLNEKIFWISCITNVRTLWLVTYFYIIYLHCIIAIILTINYIIIIIIL